MSIAKNDPRISVELTSGEESSRRFTNTVERAMRTTFFWQKRWTIRQAWGDGAMNLFEQEWSFTLNPSGSSMIMQLEDLAKTPRMIAELADDQKNIELVKEGSFVAVWEHLALPVFDAESVDAPQRYQDELQVYCDKHKLFKRESTMHRLRRRIDDQHVLYVGWIPNAVDFEKPELVVLGLRDPFLQSGTGHGDPR